jgi:crotonobetainyl-CoA:carnitine CoA-transferase CaiB-like acyl-CoA transferase
MSEALKGLKVLDLSMNLPGPYMTWLLATLGAEVVKVENPVGGDYARFLGPGSDETNPFFEAVNRNKKSLTLNLKHPEGLRIFFDLLKTYDVLVEGFRPGTMERLGLGYETTSKIQPRLIHVSISGYGQGGPYRLRAGHDLNYLSLAGVIHMTGTQEGQPCIPGIQIADLAGGSLMALSGLLAAVVQREHTGKGQYVDVSMFHGSLSLATMIFGGVEAGMEQPVPGSMFLTGRFPCYGLYLTKDGRYMSLGALEFKFWDNFCKALNRPDLVAGQFGGPEVIEEIRRIFAERTQQDWVAFMKDHDCCCEPVVALTEAVESEIVLARDMITKGAGARRYLATPFRLSESPPPRQEDPSPRLGEHTYEVLSAIGLSETQRESLARQGVI